jgi:hypothetical protein
MNRILFGISLWLMALAANAVIPIKRGEGVKLNQGGSLSRVINAENAPSKARTLFGTWFTGSATSSAGTPPSYEIRINNIRPAIKGMSLVSYDVEVDGSASDNDLVGYLIGNKLFMTVSFIDGYVSLIATFDKNFTRATYAETFVSDRDCTYEFTTNTGFDLYSCVFLVSEVGGIGGGTLNK